MLLNNIIVHSSFWFKTFTNWLVLSYTFERLLEILLVILQDGSRLSILAHSAEMLDTDVW